MRKMSRRSEKLAVAATHPDPQPDCGGCDRRDVLGGLALASLLPLGCRIDTGNNDTGVDAPPGVDADPGDGFEMCGTDLCVDLTHSKNVNLNTVGGARVLISGNRKITVVRTSDTAFATLTAVCTHQGCTVSYQAANDQLRCPCHGSTYKIDGSIVIGPALTPLATFTNTFDMTGNLLTINV